MYDRPNITFVSVISKVKYRLMLSAQLIPHYLSENERDVTRFIGQSRAVSLSAACQCQLNNSSHFHSYHIAI